MIKHKVLKTLLIAVILFLGTIALFKALDYVADFVFDVVETIIPKSKLDNNLKNLSKEEGEALNYDKLLHDVLITEKAIRNESFYAEFTKKLDWPSKNREDEKEESSEKLISLPYKSEYQGEGYKLLINNAMNDEVGYEFYIGDKEVYKCYQPTWGGPTTFHFGFREWDETALAYIVISRFAVILIFIYIMERIIRKFKNAKKEESNMK